MASVDATVDEKKILLLDEGVVLPGPRKQSPETHRLGCIRVVLVYGLAFCLALFVSNLLHPNEPVEINSAPQNADCDDPDKGYVCSTEISQFWGQYSPYFSVPSDIPDELPDDCKVTFVQLLSRHGARDPSLKKTLQYSSAVTKIRATASNLTGKYAFIKKYRYKLGADQLVPFGRRQMVYSGSKFYQRYKHLAQDATPFVRSSSQNRVAQSADAWMEGYHSAKIEDADSSEDTDWPYTKTVVLEGPGFNNTLSHALCDNIENGPLSGIHKSAKEAWVNVYGYPILSRLRADLPDAHLDMDDMHALMSMCPFDTVASRKGKLSPFCDLFTEQEWHQYNHLESLDKFYNWGRGNPLGPTQGVGFANELIARMLQKPVEDHTSTNHTLDDEPSTFPIDGSVKMYADFSHDNDLTAAFYALGLYPSTPMLSITQVDPIEFTKGWSSAWTVPFAARAYFEKMQCKSKGKEELVRIIINDRVLPLESCGGDKLGRCTLSDFIDSLQFAKDGGLWDQCFLDDADNLVPTEFREMIAVQKALNSD